MTFLVINTSTRDMYHYLNSSLPTQKSAMESAGERYPLCTNNWAIKRFRSIINKSELNLIYKHHLSLLLNVLIFFVLDFLCTICHKVIIIPVV